MSADGTKDPEERLERTVDELQEGIDRLDEHLDDARRMHDVRKAEAQPFEKVGGDWQDTGDQAGGEDPEGAGG